MSKAFKGLRIAVTIQAVIALVIVLAIWVPHALVCVGLAGLAILYRWSRP